MKMCFLWLDIQQWELIYYVAFILLTAIIAVIALITYISQAWKKPELLCKCIEANPDDSKINLFLEIFNYSNRISRNIRVQIQGTDYGIIPFLKPDESTFFFLGYRNYHDPNDRTPIGIGLDLSNNVLEVTLNIENSDSVQTYKINLRILATSATYSKKATTVGDVINSIVNKPWIR